MNTLPFTISNSQFAKYWQFPISNFREWQMVNGKCLVNGKWLMANGLDHCYIANLLPIANCKLIIDSTEGSAS